MKGWIIYKKEDVEKNISFISRLSRALATYDIQLKLVFWNQEPKDEVPAFAINRSRDYKIAEKLELKEVRVFNNSEITKISNNKKLMWKHFDGVVEQMPLTDKFPCIIKSIDGHGGKEVFMANSKDDEDRIRIAIKNKEYIKQKICSDLGVDKRIYVIGGKIVTAMIRESEDFKSNYSLGGKAKECVVEDEEKQIVEKITSTLNIDYAGIDIIYNEGKPIFNEIEDPVGAKMVYENADVDIIEMFAKYIMEELNNQENI